MTVKTDDQIEKEKQSVLAMKHAKSNMGDAIARIATLEATLLIARHDLKETKGWIGPYACTNGGGEKMTAHAAIEIGLAKIDKVL